MLLRLESLRAPLPALLALRRAAHLQGGVEPGSCRSRRSRTAWSSLNRDITWVPDHIQDGSFGKWLSNARDWSISRNRYWGSAIPVWKSDDPTYPRVDVYGSLDEARARLRRPPRRPAPAVRGRA
nr:class I tRNA ligase family protein [Angustibacter aerolatus]